ncbi:helicase-associated domain-containing protein [Naumannella sp. ID2617S]|nr:helicase-associated domain-containing protein [Naumannella sp. ID2617S]
MRSFSDALRGLGEDELTSLLTARDDLRHPAPRDLGELVARSIAPTSVHRAMDRLDRFQLTCCEGLAALPDPTSTDALVALLGAPEPAVTEALVRLRELALVWGTDELHLVRAARQAFDPYPGGLAAPSPRPLTGDSLTAALAELPEGAAEVLDRLAWGPPTGTVRNADRPVTHPATPVEHLLARGLLRPLGPDTVVLPREVALRWRGGFRTDLAWQAPAELPDGRRPARVVLHAAVGAAYEFCHDVEAVVDAVDRRPPALLRSGGIGVRDLGALARELGLDPARAGFTLEVAHAADLVSTAPPSLRVSADFDQWLRLPVAERVGVLLRRWYQTPRWYAASRLDGGHVLGPEGAARWGPGARAAVLGRLRIGSAPDPTGLGALIEWDQPGLTRVLPVADLVAAVLTEVAWLGLTALDQVSELAPVAGGAPLPEQVAAMFPEPVTELVLQADLTAVAPGPLEHQVAQELRLLADQESRGGGGVFRFSAESLRRGFDAGRDADQVLTWLERHSTSGVPQPLAYQVGDVARRHGTVRVGSARAYVRIDDPARMQAALAHPGAAALGVRQVGPQTLIADADPDEVVALLRSLGMAPAAEDAAGSVLATPPRRRATTSRRPAPANGAEPRALAQQLLAAATTARERGMRTEETLEVLRRAWTDQAAVAVDFVAADGARVTRTLVPADLAAGMVRLVGSGTAVSLPLSRIIAARRESGS